MHVDKRQLLSALRANGDAHQIGTAERELPNRIDTEEYADVLRAFGLSSSELGELASAGHPCRSGAVSSRARVGLSGPVRLGGHGWMGSGVKVRAELDRVAAWP